MLRSLYSPFSDIVLVPSTCLLTAGTPSISLNKANISVADTGTGRYTVSGPVAFQPAVDCYGVVGNPYTTAQAFGWAATGAANTIELKTFNSSAAAADDTCDFIGFGHIKDYQDYQSDGRYSVKCFQPNTRVLLFGVDADATTPALTVGRDHGVLTRVSAGVYTITFKHGFGKVPAVKATPVTFARVRISAKATNSVTIELKDSSGTVADVDFNLVVVGTSDSGEPQGGVLKSVKVGQVGCRVMPLKFTKSGATLTSLIGGKGFTLADGGTGITTVTLSRKFPRNVFVVASSTLSGEPFISSPATNGFTITTSANDGVAADGDVCALVFTFESTSDF